MHFVFGSGLIIRERLRQTSDRLSGEDVSAIQSAIWFPYRIHTDSIQGFAQVFGFPHGSFCNGPQPNFQARTPP